VNIVLMGPPGSGKGTQAVRLANEVGAEHLAMGDLLRAEVAAGSELGIRVRSIMARGELVSDDVIFALMGRRILGAAGHGGYLLDGFPRSVEQAEELMRLGAEPDIVVALDVSEDVLISRILLRGQHQNRADDTPEVIAHRLRVYAATTRPVLDYFGARGLLRTLDADAAPDAVASSILQLVHGKAISS
jgi:adenylate kinase